MSVNVVNNLLTTELTTVKKRKIVSINLYSKTGLAVTEAVNAYKMSVTVRYDICSRQLSKEYGDIGNKLSNQETSIYGYEIKQEGLYKYFILNEDEDIADCIMKNLISTATYFEMSILGNENTYTSISEELFTAILKTFSCISIDARGFKVEIPKMDFHIEYLYIGGADIFLTGDGVSFTSDTSISINNATITNGVDGYADFNLSAYNISLYNVTVNSPVSLKSIIIKPEDLLSYQKTSYSANQIKYLLSSYTDENDSSPNKLYEYPLLSIIDSYSAKISDVTIEGGDFYNGIKIAKCYEAMLNGITRTADGLSGYVTGISNNTKTYINDMTVSSGNNVYDKSSYAVFIAEDNLSLTQSLSVSNFALKNIRLTNISGCKAASISFSDGTISTDKLILSSELCGVKELRLSGIEATLSSNLDLFCPSIKIMDSTLRLNNTSEENNYLGVNNVLKIENSNIYSDIPLKIDHKLDAASTYKDSEIKATKIEILHSSSDDESSLESAGYVDSSDRNITFSNTNLRADNSISITDFNRLTSEGTEFDSKEINISTVSKMLNTLNLELENNVISTFTDCTFDNFTISRSSAISNDKFTFTDSSGELLLQNECSDSSKVSTDGSSIYNTVIFNNSKIKMKENTFLVPISTNFTSNNSVGSTVFGMNSSVTVNPGMRSSDLDNFNEITDYDNRSSSKVNYGSSETEITVESLLGLS